MSWGQRYWLYFDVTFGGVSFGVVEKRSRLAIDDPGQQLRII